MAAAVTQQPAVSTQQLLQTSLYRATAIPIPAVMQTSTANCCMAFFTAHLSKHGNGVGRSMVRMQ
jgi:hypothetical protein